MRTATKTAHNHNDEQNRNDSAKRVSLAADFNDWNLQAAFLPNIKAAYSE